MKSNPDEQRPAGVPSIRNRWDHDWMKLTKNDRPNSVPTRINRFTHKAPNEWRIGDTSAFEYDRPRIKRSGSRRSAGSGTAGIYPDWWGDASQYNSRSSQRSRSRNDDDEDEVDDFDRKVTFKGERKRILQKMQTSHRTHNYTAHPSDETQPAEVSQSEEESPVKDNKNPRKEIVSQNKKQQIQSRNDRQSKTYNRNDKTKEKPVVSNKQKQGTIYSKLQSRDVNQDRNEAPVKEKHSRNGYVVTFSPTQKKNSNKENRHENEQQNSHYEDSRNYDKHSKTYVRQCNQYQKPKREHKGKSMRDIREHDKQAALEKREAINQARHAHEYDRNQTQSKRKIPKSLQNVESVIKKRVQIDREMNRRRNNEHQNTSKDPEILVPGKGPKKSPKKSPKKNRGYKDNGQNEDRHRATNTHHRERSRSDSPSKSGSETHQIDNDSFNENNKNRHPFYNQRERHQKYDNPDNQRQNPTEGSSYPSVTQASAPPQEYYGREQRQGHHQNYTKTENNQRNEQFRNQPERNYRPSSISQNPDRENNVVDITEGFLNSPMMTQFSDNSEPKRKPYVNVYTREEENKHYEQKEHSGYNDSSSYGQYGQNRSNESIYGNQNPYDNQYAYNQHNSNVNPASHSNTNYSRFNEDQVLFKSNGFDGNATSSGRANDSAMLQSPTIHQLHRDEDASDSKLTGTANFEKPRDYDVKYSDYRKTDTKDRSFTGKPSYEPSRAGDRGSYINPFKTRDYYPQDQKGDNSMQESFNYPPGEGGYQSKTYAPRAPGSYKYLPAWEGGNDASLNSPPPMSMDTSQKYGPPKYLAPQEDSKYNSQYDEEDYESEEDEESESDYDSDITKTEDFRSNSSLSNYQVPDNAGIGYGYPNPGGRGYGQHVDNYRDRESTNYYQPSPNYPNMYQSIPNQSEVNPQMMSSIGSDPSAAPSHYQPPANRGGRGQNPYGMY